MFATIAYVYIWQKLEETNDLTRITLTISTSYFSTFLSIFFFGEAYFRDEWFEVKIIERDNRPIG